MVISQSGSTGTSRRLTTKEQDRCRVCLIEEASQSWHLVMFVLNGIPKAVLTSEAGLGIVEVLWGPPRSYFVWVLDILGLTSMLSALIRLTCLSLPQGRGRRYQNPIFRDLCW